MTSTLPTAHKVLIVIPCLNEEKHLAKLMQQLLMANGGSKYLFVIADGGSTDKTAQIAKDLAAQNNNVIYLENPKRIQSAALNLAVEKYGADAEYLIRIDAHSDYPDNYCEILLQEADGTRADSVVVSMQTVGTGDFQQAVAAAQNSLLGTGGSAHRASDKGGRWIDHGHHALMRLDAFRAVDGYDESFAHNEDAELDLRLDEQGYKIWLTGKTTVTYYPRATPGALFWQYFGYGSGRAQTLQKHYMLPKIRQLLPVLVAPSVLLLLIAPVFPVTSLPFFAWALLCLAYGAWLAREAQDSNIFLAGPAAMIMHFAWSLGFWKSLLQNRLPKND